MVEDSKIGSLELLSVLQAMDMSSFLCATHDRVGADVVNYIL